MAITRDLTFATIYTDAGLNLSDTITYTTLNDGTTSLTATVAELNTLDGITATVTELNYLDGVTSNVQTQIDNISSSFTIAADSGTNDTVTTGQTLTFAGGTGIDTTVTDNQISIAVDSTIAPLASPTFTGTLTYATLNDGTTSLTATVAELNYVDGVTSNIQTQIDNISSSFTLAADSGANDIFNTDETLTFTGGTGIDTTVANNVITIAVDSTIAPLASPTFTGTPLAPTAAAATNTTQIATTAFVQTAVSNLVDAAPSTLDTLNELAAALGDDANFSTTVTNSIATKLPLAGGTMTGNIVMSGAQTVDGRDLSVDGTKLDGIESGATADQTASEILTALLTVDGAGSGLDADLLDGISSASFFRSDVADSAIGFASSTSVNGTGDAGIGINSGGRLGFDQSGTRSWTVKATGGNLAFDAGDGNGNLTKNGGTIWHAGNDGSGSGLDADLLDGQQGSYYAAASHNHGRLYAETGTTTNYLSLSSSNELELFNSGGSIIDLYLNYSGGSTSLKGPGGGTIWHAGNDGSGSGLDADSLDGVQGSNYLRTDSASTISVNHTIDNTHQLNFGNSSTAIWKNTSKNFVIRNDDNEDIYIDARNVYIRTNRPNAYEMSVASKVNGAVELYYDNVKKLETTSTGATVTGTAVATKFQTTSTKIETAIFRINDQTLTTSTTIASDENASCAGPLTINTGVTLTVDGNLTVV